jgi:Zinc-finger domain
MRDERQTGYTPKPVEGITPVQRIEVTTRNVPCDGEVGVGGLGHPRTWMRIAHLPLLLHHLRPQGRRG